MSTNIYEDNYVPVNTDKCDNCIHRRACLTCCHNKNTDTTTSATPHYNYEGPTETTIIS